jgi:predicted lipid carrier protein YhbT
MKVEDKLKSLVKIAQTNLDSFDLLSHMNEVIELVNKDEELLSEIRNQNGKVIVFEAMDTGRAITIEFKNGIIEGRLGTRQESNLRFSASEETYLKLLNGELDPDSAFFKRRIKITGPITEALRFKNIFFAKVLAK